MVAILVCDRFHWTLEEYLGTDAGFIDRVFQFMQIEGEARSRQNKKVEQGSKLKS